MCAAFIDCTATWERPHCRKRVVCINTQLGSAYITSISISFLLPTTNRVAQRCTAADTEDLPHLLTTAGTDPHPQRCLLHMADNRRKAQEASQFSNLLRRMEQILNSGNGLATLTRIAPDPLLQRSCRLRSSMVRFRSSVRRDTHPKRIDNAGDWSRKRSLLRLTSEKLKGVPRIRS